MPLEGTSTESTSTTTSTESAAPAVTETVVADKGTGGTSHLEGGDNGEAAAAAAAAAQYTPNYKFKVMDKEHEIPEGFRTAIKDAKSEKEAKEIFEKAYGLDVVKPKLQETRVQRDQAVAKATQWEKDYQSLRTDYQRGDLDSFFQKMQIPQEKILQWVLDKVNLSKLPPEQQAMAEQKRQAENHAFQLQKSNESYQEQMLDQARQAKSNYLEFALARPDTKAVADAFEARTGKSGSFAEAVRSHGEAVWYRSGGKVDLTPDQAIKQVMELYGITAQEAAAANPQLSATGGGVNTPGQATKPKVIPNISGRASASPVNKGVRSLADIVALRKEKFGS